MAYITVDLYDLETDDLIDELESRGFKVVGENDDLTDSDVHKIVQMHRCGDPRWESEAIAFLYNLAGKVV